MSLFWLILLAEVAGVQPTQLFTVLALFKSVYLSQLGTSIFQYVKEPITDVPIRVELMLVGSKPTVLPLHQGTIYEQIFRLELKSLVWKTRALTNCAISAFSILSISLHRYGI